MPLRKAFQDFLCLMFEMRENIQFVLPFLHHFTTVALNVILLNAEQKSDLIVVS